MSKVAIVDDSELVLAVIVEHLEAAGIDAVPIDTPIGASMRLAQEQPDLILVDLKMASMSGDKVVVNIKRSSRLKHTKVLLFSSSSDEVLKAAAESCGANGYFQKTGDPLELVETVQKWLDKGP